MRFRPCAATVKVTSCQLKCWADGESPLTEFDGCPAGGTVGVLSVGSRESLPNERFKTLFME